MNVIGTVGLPGSGKGEAANVAEAAGIPVVVMGDVIRAECRRRGLDPAEHHGRIARALRAEEGDDAIAARTLPLIREAAAESERDAVLVDGLRSTVELERFREAFGDDFTLVAIHAPFALRAERLDARGRDDSDSDLEALRERDAREIDLGLGATLDRADVEIDNTGTLAEFQARVREVLGVADESLEAADPAEPTNAGGDGA
ncbi:AAA family ATPase [Halorubrum sp. AD140]|uniref:AAA family ATPase n=1 Tax=Halorubrum sp. AD140 TaxID=3050073 RepID=UPI002ACCCB98|nr:AAA family ATPase [Halorubrum sp. AD140]MDZ5809834.1 AAA family ATPase [Halorubrum sp. AD140]